MPKSWQFGSLRPTAPQSICAGNGDFRTLCSSQLRRSLWSRNQRTSFSKAPTIELWGSPNSEIALVQSTAVLCLASRADFNSMYGGMYGGRRKTTSFEQGIHVGRRHHEC